MSLLLPYPKGIGGSATRKKNMKYLSFDKILFVSAMLLAVCGAYYSIVGIATLFSGAMISVGIMASAIEFAKVCSITFLYRYWKKINIIMKNYMCIASIILMMITSVGISGFLLAAYQKSSIEFKSNQEKIVTIEGQKGYLHDKISQSKSRIQTLNDMRKLQENRMNEAIGNAFLARNPTQLKQIQAQTGEMIKSADGNIKLEQDRIQSTTDEIRKIDQEVNEMKFSSASKKDIRTFQFVAEQFGTTLDTVAKWFIFTIIFVFDPLAVALILAYNVVAYKTPDDLINTKKLKEPVMVDTPITSSIHVVNNPIILDKYIPSVTSSILQSNVTSSILQSEVTSSILQSNVTSSILQSNVTSSIILSSSNAVSDIYDANKPMRHPWM